MSQPETKMNEKLYTQNDLDIALLKQRQDTVSSEVKRIDHKLNWTIGLIVTGIIIPIILHHYGLI